MLWCCKLKFGLIFNEVEAINDNPYFVGKDVAVILGYAKPTDAVRKLVDEEDRGISKMETPSGIQEMTIINESGFYSLILSSKLPNIENTLIKAEFSAFKYQSRNFGFERIFCMVICQMWSVCPHLKIIFSAFRFLTAEFSAVKVANLSTLTS